METFILDLFREFGLTGGFLIFGLFLFAAGYVPAIAVWRSRANARIARETAEAEAQRVHEADQIRRENELSNRLWSQFEARLAEQSKLLTELHVQIEQAETRSDEQDKRINELSETKAQLEKRVRELADELQRVKQLYTAERQYTTELKGVNHDLKVVNDRLVEDNRRQAEQIVEQRAMIDNLETKVSSLERENARLKSELDQLGERLRQLTERVDHTPPPIPSP